MQKRLNGKSQTTDPLNIFGYEEDTHQSSTLEIKDKILAQEKLSEGMGNSSSYRRLKFVMDYWCALWFWQIEKADLLPSRYEYFMELAVILGETEMTFESEPELPLFPDTSHKNEVQEFVDNYGLVNVEKLAERFPRLGLVAKIAKEKRFFHWELEFADIFADNGGFDLFLGNPPWIKVEWDQGGVMGDAEPLYDLRSFSSSELNKIATIGDIFVKYPKLLSIYFLEFETSSATQNFINAKQNYALLEGQKANLYKCFIPQSWLFSNLRGFQGFIHEESSYDESQGGKFREFIYKRLRFHFRFENELNLFHDVGNEKKFGINIYGCNQSVNFCNIVNLFSPKTIDICFEHNGYGSLPGIKNDTGKWNTDGHARRIVYINEKSLKLFTELYEEVGTSFLQARLPVLHSQELLSVIEKFAKQPKRLANYRGQYFSSYMFDENKARREGITKRITCFPKSVKDWILSGPHFYVGLPFYQTPKSVCNTHRAYDGLNLMVLQYLLC